MEKGNDNKNRKRGFFGGLIVFGLTLCAMGGLLAMALSVLNPYVDPNVFVWTSFFGLAFWEIFIFNLLVFFALLMMKTRKVWIAVLALLVAVPGLTKSFAMGKRLADSGDLRVMTYNVHNFKHVDGKTGREDFAKEIVEKVKKMDPDVLSCQEFSSFKKGKNRPECIKLFSENVGMPYVYYNLKKNYGGNVIFSKYPVKCVASDSGFGEQNTYGIMVSVDAGAKGKFHVANLHLLSYQITDDEIDVLMESSKSQENLEKVGKSVAHKLKYAFERRSVELQEVLSAMPDVDGPVIVCGDFNDAPLSYTYRLMQKAGFVDSFVKVGWGIRPTYGGRLPLLRIDYAWGNDEVEPVRYQRLRFKASDHYPVVMDFNVKQNNK